MQNLRLEDVPRVMGELYEAVNRIEFFLKENQLQQVDQNEPLDISQAADYLSLSKYTIYTLVRKRKIPFSKKGKRLYFSIADLKQWVASGKRQTADETVNNVVLNFGVKAGGYRGR